LPLLKFQPSYYRPISNKSGLSRQIFVQVLNIKYHDNPYGRSHAGTCPQTDGQTLRSKKAQFALYVKKTTRKNWIECSLAQHRFPIRFVSFFIVASSVCLLVHVTMVDKIKAVVFTVC